MYEGHKKNMFQEHLINFIKFTNIIVYRIEFDNARWSDPRNSGGGSLVSGGLGWEGERV